MNLVFFSLEDWDSVWRRNQFICAGLHDRHPDMNILWVCPQRDVSHGPTLKSILNGRVSLWKNFYALKDFPRIKVLHPLKLFPNRFAAAFNQRFRLSQIENATAKLGWTNFDVWVNDQSVRKSLPKMFGKMIYDITDDWTQIKQSPRQAQIVRADDEWLVQHSNTTVVCSKTLFDSRSGMGGRVILIPNAVDCSRLHPEALRKTDLPADLSAIPTPIVGYVGTLHEDRVDVNLLCEVAIKLPKVNFVLVGPNALTEQSNSLLDKHKNVHILGPRNYETLPSYFAAFSICMTPHVVSSFTDSLDPLKLYEYMATGKPIVSTRCAGFREYPNLISLADTSEDFAQMISKELSLATDSDRISQRLDWAKKQDWQSRILEIEKILF